MDRLVEAAPLEGPRDARVEVVEPEGEGGSELTISVDIPGMVNPLDPLPVAESLRRIKELIESER